MDVLQGDVNGEFAIWADNRNISGQLEAAMRN